MEATTRAVVTLTVEVRDCGNWGLACALEQVQKQATESAIGRVRNLLERTGEKSVTIIGAVKVLAITSEMKP